MQQRSLPPRAVPATGFRRAPLTHALPVLTALLCDTCTARTPRAAASSLAVRRQHTAAVRPVLALQPKRLPPAARGAIGLAHPSPQGSPKRSDGSLCCPTGESKLLAAQHEAGATRPQAALTGPPTAALTAYLAGYLPWGGEGGGLNAAPPAAHGSRVAAGGEDGAYLCGALEGWGELNQWPRAQPSGSRLRLKREHGAYRFFRSRSTAREHCCGTGRAAQQCTRRARGAGVTEHKLSALAERVRVAPSGSRWLGLSQGGSLRCCMQRGKQQRSVRGGVRSEMTALWRCLTTTCRRVSCNRMLNRSARDWHTDIRTRVPVLACSAS